MNQANNNRPQISIASPCSAPWEAMSGSDQTRFCGECKKNVFHLSAMSANEAKSLLTQNQEAICVRATVDGDGRLISQPKPSKRASAWPQRLLQLASVLLLLPWLGACRRDASAGVPPKTPIEDYRDLMGEVCIPEDLVPTDCDAENGGENQVLQGKALPPEN